MKDLLIWWAPVIATNWFYVSFPLDDFLPLPLFVYTESLH